jgi:hypothetical protein
MKRLTIFALAAMSTGCIVSPQDGKSGVHYYAGVVRVAYPKKSGALTAVDVKTLGLGFDGAVFAGWRDSKFIFAKPDECRTIIILKDRMEIAHVTKLLDSLGEKPCVADFSHSLPPP